MNKMFEKADQVELKAQYKELLKDVWGSDTRMIDYCSKESDVVIRTSKGYLINVEKESIEKDFCFGYHCSSTDNESYDNANNMADFAKKNVKYFLEKNLEGIERTIKELEENEVYVINHYYSQKNNILKQFRIYAYYQTKDNGSELLNENDKNLLIQAYKEEKEKFTKRLNTYLKKYGLSKVHTWSYWLDE